MMTVDESIVKPCEEDFKNIKANTNSPKRDKMPLLSTKSSESRIPSLLNIQQICSHSQRGMIFF